MPKRLRNTHPAVCAAGVALADANIPPDVQELLLIGSLHGDRKIAPGALASAVTAARSETLEEVACWHDGRAELSLAPLDEEGGNASDFSGNDQSDER